MTRSCSAYSLRFEAIALGKGPGDGGLQQLSDNSFVNPQKNARSPSDRHSTLHPDADAPLPPDHRQLTTDHQPPVTNNLHSTTGTASHSPTARAVVISADTQAGTPSALTCHHVRSAVRPVTGKKSLGVATSMGA